MKRLMILAFSALLILGSSLNSQTNDEIGLSSNKEIKAGQGKGFRGDGYGQKRGQNRIEEKLNLTDDQKSKISDLRFEHDKSALELKTKMQENKLIIRKMMRDNKIDKEKLLQITQENSELHAKNSLLKTTMWLDIHELLDDTQREEWSKTFGKDGRGGRKGRNNGRESRNGFCSYDCFRK